MLRYVLLMVLIGFAFSDGYKTKRQRHREYFRSEPNYRDYDDYVYPIYGKDSESGNTRPSIFSYWNNILRTRLPRFNITNPFTRLFSPYVIKVGDPNDGQPIRNRNKKKQTELEDEFIYEFVNPFPNTLDSENAQYFYDPVTQQYYEVQETASQDYSPQNNYYATTFNDEDEIVINLGENDNKEEQKDQSTNGDEDEERYAGRVKKIGLMGKYNSPAIRTFKTKRLNKGRKANASENRKSFSRIKEGNHIRRVYRLATV